MYVFPAFLSVLPVFLQILVLHMIAKTLFPGNISILVPIFAKIAFTPALHAIPFLPV